MISSAADGLIRKPSVAQPLRIRGVVGNHCDSLNPELEIKWLTAAAKTCSKKVRKVKGRIFDSKSRTLTEKVEAAWSGRT